MTEKLYYKKWRDRNVESGISKGMNVKTVKSLLGHSTAVTTVNITKGHTQLAAISEYIIVRISRVHKTLILIFLFIERLSMVKIS